MFHQIHSFMEIIIHGTLLWKNMNPKKKVEVKDGLQNSTDVVGACTVHAVYGRAL